MSRTRLILLRTLSFLALLSLLLLCPLVILWIRSPSQADYFTWLGNHPNTFYYSLISGSGRLTFCHWVNPGSKLDPPTGSYSILASDYLSHTTNPNYPAHYDAQARFHFGPFAYTHNASDTVFTALTVPFWFAALLLLLPPTLRLIFHLRGPRPPPMPLKRLLPPLWLVSLLFAAAVLILWTRSFFLRDEFELPCLQNRCNIDSAHGILQTRLFLAWPVPEDFDWNRWPLQPDYEGAFVLRRDGWGIRPDVGPEIRGNFWTLRFPHPLLLLLTLPAIALYLRRLFFARRTRRRRATGLCPTCGYDLRTHLAGAAGAKCPECGSAITPNAPVPASQSRTPEQRA
jgi:hypothetical protein